MSVLLGLADEGIDEEEDVKLSWIVNKIGGKANWMELAPSSPPSCPLCGNFLYLVVQIYCPLDKSEYHRTLHVFACAEMDCWDTAQSWKVYRSQCLDMKPCLQSDTQQKETSPGWSKEEWCADATDWGLEDSSSEAIVAALKEKQYKEDLKVIEDKTCNVEISRPVNLNKSCSSTESSISTVPHFIPRYIIALSEPEDECLLEDGDYIQGLIDQYEKREGAIDDVMETGIEFTSESYEKSGPVYDDIAFHRYKKRISRSPSQCLRYQWNGHPLLLTSKKKPSTDLDTIPNCERCNSKRVFELQLLSSISCFLREKTPPNAREKETASYEPEEDIFNGEICARQERVDYGIPPLLSDTRLEFGSVYIYSCSQSCWSADEFHPPLEEFIVIQVDPDRYITAKGK